MSTHNQPRLRVLLLILLLAGIFFAGAQLHRLMLESISGTRLTGDALLPFAGNDTFARLQRDAQSMHMARDPFVSIPITPATDHAVVDVVVKGIFWDAGRPMAIINDAIVRVGDIVNNRTVVDIQKESVILESEGAFLEFRVRKDE
jgi:hypothetical protein